jgi:glutaredoxin-related protein
MSRFEKPPVMDFEGMKNSFSDAIGSMFSTTPEIPEIEVKQPAGATAAAAKGMPALAPIFNVEADLQAFATNLGSYDEDEVRAEIEETINSAPVVIYTYPLSPFSSEALAILESTGCEVKNVELGAEWFALGPKGSATRVELRKLYGQGSLPHIFIGGEWIGGLATGADGGLAGLVERDELVPMLFEAGAV